MFKNCFAAQLNKPGSSATKRWAQGVLKALEKTDKLNKTILALADDERKNKAQEAQVQRAKKDFNKALMYRPATLSKRDALSAVKDDLKNLSEVIDKLTLNSYVAATAPELSSAVAFS